MSQQTNDKSTTDINFGTSDDDDSSKYTHFLILDYDFFFSPRRVRLDGWGLFYLLDCAMADTRMGNRRGFWLNIYHHLEPWGSVLSFVFKL